VHGVIRATTDIDLLVDKSGVAAIEAVAKSLGFIFPAAPMGFEDGVELHRLSKNVDGQVVTLDLLVTSAAYRTVWDSRVRVAFRESTISVVSREGLIEMKLAAARPQDLMDVQNLREGDR